MTFFKSYRVSQLHSSRIIRFFCHCQKSKKNAAISPQEKDISLESCSLLVALGDVNLSLKTLAGLETSDISPCKGQCENAKVRVKCLKKSPSSLAQPCQALAAKHKVWRK